MQNKRKEPDLTVDLAGIWLKNPITTASGTFSPRDSGQFYDLNQLGAMITKGIAPEPWEGNPSPRIAETYGGMLNAVGLQNPGVEAYIREELPYLEQFSPPVIANVVGRTVEDYCRVAEALSDTSVAMLEVNISCPNVKAGGIGFGTDPAMAALVTREVKRISKKPVLIKLSPNVTDITEIARAVESEGADGISLINTLLGMSIDARRAKILLANGTGGLSGPAIKPVALRMVYQVCRAVQIPVLGLGGIRTGEDAAEFLMAGASAVSVGTAALFNPLAPIEILQELKEFMMEMGYRTIAEMRQAFQEGQGK
jgi:dihydroorotate dehydrogenase (NAD+) catalytic subunit